MYTTAHKKIRMTCFEAFWFVPLLSCSTSVDEGLTMLLLVCRYTHHLAFIFMLCLVCRSSLSFSDRRVLIRQWTLF
jgi:hypothetical protein